MLPSDIKKFLTAFLELASLKNAIRAVSLFPLMATTLSKIYAYKDGSQFRN
jgi:hypothetical protein